jgi:ComF family protein
VGCGARGAEVCTACIIEIRSLGPVCPHCSRPSREGRICRQCAGRVTPLRAILAGYPFEGALRAAILALKYRGRTRLLPLLSAALATPLAARPLEIDLIVPVPLSPGRARARGFNQAELIARPLAAANSWPLDAGALVRSRETAQQTRLPARERRANVAGAFAVPDPATVRDRRILLIDDVCTTGATLEACAGPLLEAGAAGVWALVVAREV